MSIKRFLAEKDNTITNAYKENLVSTGSYANMGASDILEIFSIYAQATTSSVEKARILIQFSDSDITAARTAGEIPSSGSVSFKLKLYNAPHSETLPKSFTVSSHAILKDWDEGIGLDMEQYGDLDSSNWVSSSFATAWSSLGGDFKTDDYVSSQIFKNGTEDLEIDITHLVEVWLSDGAPSNQGLLLKLSDSFEGGSLEKSFYTKKFFARGTEFFFKRPIIEAQWDSSIQNTASLTSPYKQEDEYVFNITNLKREYKTHEKVNLKVHTRNKNWQPNIYTKTSNSAPTDIVDEVYYRITRVVDNLEVVPFSYNKTPSFSKLSYNSSGSNFDLDMSILEPNYLYEVSFLRKTGSIQIEQKEKFRFRVE